MQRESGNAGFPIDSTNHGVKEGEFLTKRAKEALWAN
jgi:hypothetical protein